jgi:tRNA(fMet)-specific endonuclease VapC
VYICIYIRQRRPAQILQRFRRLKVGEAAISVIADGELIYGAEKSEQREAAMRQLEELASLLPVLPLPVGATRTYGALRAELEAGGQITGNNDLWIAAHAKAAKLVLVTDNGREFQRVSGFEIQNWANLIRADERRALSRRKFAIRAFDAARR